jgi:hypothetical protein
MEERIKETRRSSLALAGHVTPGVLAFAFIMNAQELEKINILLDCDFQLKEARVLYHNGLTSLMFAAENQRTGC